MLQSKKQSLNEQNRREIAGLLERGKTESAMIRVEHIIREDYMLEALEMIELFCEILHARFGLLAGPEYTPIVLLWENCGLMSCLQKV